jgi:hypothetical protein
MFCIWRIQFHFRLMSSLNHILVEAYLLEAVAGVSDLHPTYRPLMEEGRAQRDGPCTSSSEASA